MVQVRRDVLALCAILGFVVSLSAGVVIGVRSYEDGSADEQTYYWMIMVSRRDFNVVQREFDVLASYGWSERDSDKFWYEDNSSYVKFYKYMTPAQAEEELHDIRMDLKLDVTLKPGPKKLW